MAVAAQRVGRLADQAGGGSMITTKTLASYDDDGEEEVLHRLNVILKVCVAASCSLLVQSNVPAYFIAVMCWLGMHSHYVAAIPRQANLVCCLYHFEA